MTNDTRPQPVCESALDVIEKITREATPTDVQVSDWHYTNVILERDWDRPLVAVLRFFVERGVKATSTMADPGAPEIDLVTSDFAASTSEATALVP